MVFALRSMLMDELKFLMHENFKLDRLLRSSWKRLTGNSFWDSPQSIAIYSYCDSICSWVERENFLCVICELMFDMIVLKNERRSILTFKYVDTVHVRAVLTINTNNINSFKYISMDIVTILYWKVFIRNKTVTHSNVAVNSLD